MYGRRQHSDEYEIAKWLIFAAITGALVLFAPRPATGDVREPRLPPCGLAVDTTDVRATRRIWRILELHVMGQHEQAIEQWTAMPQTDAVEEFRTIGVAAANLALRRLDDTICVLESARDRGADNSITHHLRGVVYLAQAKDYAIGTAKREAAKLRRAARSEFESAIAKAEELNLDASIQSPGTRFIALRRYETIFPEMLLPPKIPRLSNLLTVLELNDFRARSHVFLAELDLDAGQLGDVEMHLDAAADSRVNTSDAYLELGHAYTKRNLHQSATRAYLKSMKATRRKSSAAAKLQRIRPLSI